MHFDENIDIKAFLSKHAAPLALCAGALIWLCFSMGVSKGLVLHPESATVYFPYYTSQEHGFLQKIFNPYIGNLNSVYRARELSFAADWLDYNMLLWSIRHITLHFHSLIYYILALCMVCANFSLAAKFSGRAEDRPAIALLSLAMLFTPFFFLTFGIYRSAKILSAVFSLLMLWLCALHITRIKNASFSWPLFTTAFALGLCASFSDEQGIAVAALLCAAGLAYSAFTKSRNGLLPAAGLGAAILCYAFYAAFIGPAILAHYNPQMRLENSGFPAAMMFSPHILFAGMRETMLTIWQSAGSIPPAASAALICCITAYAYPQRAAISRLKSNTVAAMFTSTFAVICVCGIALVNSAMFIAHPLIFHAQFMGQYGLPQAAIFYALFSIAIILLPCRPIIKTLTAAVLLSANILSLNGYMRGALNDEAGAFRDITAIAIAKDTDTAHFEPSAFARGYADYAWRSYVPEDARSSMRLWPYCKVVDDPAKCANSPMICLTVSKQTLENYHNWRSGIK
jgi:hypothetical protein